MEDIRICPYPGLRPFTEDEAVFFKGREEHIDQIIRQLEVKKFLMLTGASGDGKSSLVYAGVIPNARAGFFKAKFNNWVIADFRPERAPLKNLARTVNEQLKLGDAGRCEKELGYGFSALIDTYKSSSFWVDQKSEAFLNLDAEEQKKRKRKCANLMILVDQFEEFFTNPENYIHGQSSHESQTVVNLLLETTRLAMEQDVPIYIICTMRSDYIGQCASFRGLPEYIGYSQFFVPRLKRKEIYQVIEEPAMLNGDRISKRLVEMLINEMNDGIDQLPVLQHALNQIWQKADMGRQEMDLIHFAKINGIPRNQLSEKDQETFDAWFAELPQFKKDLFRRSSLGDVLDAHANELYELANLGLEDEISLKDAKLIIKTVFKCLTKIDEARAVRNRMSLEEVTSIINRPHITTELVAKVIHPFRMQGNTFLKPFIFLDASHPDTISPDSVLDITHESLIRNWDKLSFWANQEHEHLLTWQDFYKQLQRWVNSGKSSGYLLPIGPLNFFETWFNKIRMNKFWLARYDDREIPKEEKLAEAELTLHNTREFISRSARRLFISRTVLKYGADKLLAAFGITVFVFCCTYFYFDYRKKQNVYVLKDIEVKSRELLGSKFIKSKVKAEYIIAADRLKPGSFLSLLNGLGNDSTRIETVREMFFNTIEYQEKKKDGEVDNPLVGQLYDYQVNYLFEQQAFSDPKNFVRNLNHALVLTWGDIILNREQFRFKDNSLRKEYFNRFYKSFLSLLEDTTLLRSVNIDQFNKLIQVIPHVIGYDKQELERVTRLLSPFSEEGKLRFALLYPKEKKVFQDWTSTNFISHNGGYYQLSNLYALLGKFPELNRSFDSLIINNKNFLDVNIAFNYKRILLSLVISDHLDTEQGLAFLSRVEKSLKTKSPFSTFTQLYCDAVFPEKDLRSFGIRNVEKSSQWHAADFQIQGESVDQKILDKMFHSLERLYKADQSGSLSRQNFNLALLHKTRAFAYNNRYIYQKDTILVCLNRALRYFDQVDRVYQESDVTLGEGSFQTTVKMSKLFKFPGLASLSAQQQPFLDYYTIENFKNKGIFLEYILQVRNLAAFYNSKDEAEYLNDFLLSYFSTHLLNMENEPEVNLKALEAMTVRNGLNEAIDRDALLAFFTVYYNSKGQSSKAAEFEKRIDLKRLMNKDKFENEDRSPKYYRLARSLVNYYLEQPVQFEDEPEQNRTFSEQYTKAFALIALYPNPFQRRNTLLRNIDSLQLANKVAVAISLLDTLINTDVVRTTKFGNQLFVILGRLSTTDGDKLALNLLKDRSDKVKQFCLNYFVQGKSEIGNYFEASTFIPEYVSSSSQLQLYTTIIKSELKRKQEPVLSGWSYMDRLYPDNNLLTGAFEETENQVLFTSSD